MGDSFLGKIDFTSRTDSSCAYGSFQDRFFFSKNDVWYKQFNYGIFSTYSFMQNHYLSDCITCYEIPWSFDRWMCDDRWISRVHKYTYKNMYTHACMRSYTRAHRHTHLFIFSRLSIMKSHLVEWQCLSFTTVIEVGQLV